jgi:hypothetical protein
MRSFDLDLHIRIDGTGILRFNQFRCRRDKLPELVSKWKYTVWREHGCRNMEVERIMVNNEEDIKDEVKKFENDMGRSDLPF